jgi:hypothetical protein
MAISSFVIRHSSFVIRLFFHPNVESQRMSSLLTFLMLVILFATVATLYTEGMWSNAISLINVVTAALLAVNYFEPLAAWLEGLGDWWRSCTYVWDFLALWILFAVFSLIFRSLTDQISRVKVRFLKVADQIGSAVFALWIGWVMVCFTMMTLHTAPLDRTFLFGGFQPEERMFLGFAPDRQWLGFVQQESEGAFCRLATPEEWKQEKYVFDPRGEYLLKYATRRANLQANVAKSGSILVGP